MNIDNKRVKATDSKGRKLPPGITYNSGRPKPYCVKYTDSNGKRHQKDHKDLASAKRFLVEMQHTKDQGLVPPDNRITVDDLFDRLCEFALSSSKPGTRDVHKSRYRTLIQPYIGRMKVCNVRRDDCQYIINYLWKTGYRDGRKYKRSTLMNVISTLTLLFEHAVDNDILQKSPVRGLKLPSDAEHPRETPSLTESDIPKFLEAARKYDYYPQFALVLETGLRVGELSALTWNDVDFEKNMLHVRHSLNRVGNEWLMGRPKSMKGNRDIPLTENAHKILLQQRASSFSSPAESGFEDLVFRSKNGRPIFHGGYDDALKAICKRAGVPYVSMHGLRHTFITIMRLHGMTDVVLDKIVGHARGNVTDDVYVHLSDADLQREMTKVYENVAKVSA